MSRRGTLRLATRGSDLALRQAAAVGDALESRRREVELVEVETRGDQLKEERIHRLGRIGAFVRALDDEVLAGEVDAAIHSMKDMPTEFPGGLVVAGVPERAAAGDVLLTPEGTSLEGLPDGATVGTSSVRRRAQLLRARPDLGVEPLRGNVDTRVETLLAPPLQREHERRIDAAESEGDADGSFDRSPEEWFEDLAEIERRALEREVETEFDAIVLAEAGLARSGLLEQVAHERLPRSEFVPAPGQGALAVTCADPDATEAVREAVDHAPTRVATTVERTLLSGLGGGCVAPIGVNARVRGEYVHTQVQVLGPEGEEAVEATRDLPVTDHANAAASLADDLRERGAAALVEAATEAS